MKSPPPAIRVHCNLAPNSIFKLLYVAILLSGTPVFGQEDRDLFVTGERALRAGDYSTAQKSFESLLKRNPKNTAALANLGVVFAQTRDYEQAATTYRKALALNPTHPLLHLNLGLALFKQDQYAAAAKEFEQTLTRQPSHLQAQELLASCRIYTGQADKAAASLEALLQDRPNDPSLLYLAGLAQLRLRKPEQAKPFFDRLTANTTPAQAHFLAGKALAENEQFDEAIRALEAARQADAKLEGIHRELGKVYISLRRAEDAEASLRAAIAADPGDIEATYFLAGALILQDKSKEAMPLLDTVAVRRPSFWGVHYYRGRILLQQGSVAPAIQALERAATLQPDESSIYYQLARAYRQANRPAAASTALKKLTALKKAESDDSTLLRKK